MKERYKIQSLYAQILTDKTRIILEIFRIYFKIPLPQKPFLYLFSFIQWQPFTLCTNGCKGLEHL